MKAGKYLSPNKDELNLNVPTFSHSPNRTFSVRDEENEIPGHSRECSLRTVSPLLETDLMNRQPTSTDSADTLVALQFAKRYELLRKENESLRKTVIQQDQQILKLKAVVASLQSDGYSSDSRHEKSTSTQSSSVPVLRVTPQKRSTTSSSTQTPTQTPRSGRRSAGRRLEFSSEESESTPTASPAVQNRPNRYHHNFTQPFSEARRTEARPVSSEEVSPQRSTQRRRPTVLTRSLSTSASPSVATPTSNRINSAPSTPGPFFVMGTDRSDQNENVLASATDSPGYYLKLHRPGFIQNLEHRQKIIRTASVKRSKVEAVRKDTVKAVAEGKVRATDVEDILLFDPTRIQAFSKHEMKALTRRHLTSTKEFVEKVNKKKKAVDDQANRILARCYSLRTRSQLHGSTPDLSSLHF